MRAFPPQAPPKQAKRLPSTKAKLANIPGGSLRQTPAKAERATRQAPPKAGTHPHAVDTSHPHVAHEAVSVLDVSVQAQILRLLADLRARLGLSMIFITHDLRVAAQVCDRLAVMRAGHVIEWGPAADVLGAPQHPYTQALIASVPGRGRSTA